MRAPFGALKKLSTSLTLLGSLILAICVGVLTVIWAINGQWVWFVVGVLIIVMNVGLLVTELRPVPTAKTWHTRDVRALIDGVDNDIAAARKLRKADRGLSAVAAWELVQRARRSDPGDTAD